MKNAQREKLASAVVHCSCIACWVTQCNGSALQHRTRSFNNSNNSTNNSRTTTQQTTQPTTHAQQLKQLTHNNSNNSTNNNSNKSTNKSNNNSNKSTNQDMIHYSTTDVTYQVVKLTNTIEILSLGNLCLNIYVFTVYRVVINPCFAGTCNQTTL